MTKITSLPAVRRGDWIFKASVSDGTILIFAYNDRLCYSTMKFFDSEAMAKNWSDYIVMTTELMGDADNDSSG